MVGMDLTEALKGLLWTASTNSPSGLGRAQTIAEKTNTTLESAREFYDAVKEKFDEIESAYDELSTLVETLDEQIDRAETAAGELAAAEKDYRADAHSELVEAADELHTTLTDINGDEPAHDRLAEAVKELIELLAA